MALDRIISHAFLLCVTKKDSIIDHIYGYYLDFETLTVPSRSMAHNDLMVLIEDIVKQSIDSFTEGSFFFL